MVISVDITKISPPIVGVFNLALWLSSKYLLRIWLAFLFLNIEPIILNTYANKIPI